MNIINDLLDRGNSKSQGDEAIICYYVPNKNEEDVLTSDSHETKSDEEQKKEVAIYNIINVTTPLGEMFKDSTPAISDSEDQQSLIQLSGNVEAIADEIRSPKIF